MNRISFMKICKASFLSFVLLLYGCSIGLYSQKPIFGKDKSDKIDGISGYWVYESDSIIENGKLIQKPVNLDGQQISLIEDNSKGFPFFKDYIYKLSLIKADKNDKSSFLELRARKARQGYLLQACVINDPSEHACYFHYLTIKDNKIFLYPSYDRNLPEETKNILGVTYINAEDRNSIEIPNDFIDHHGAEILESLTEKQIIYPVLNTEKDDASTFMLIGKRISREEAKTRIDKMREIKAESKK